MCSIISFDMNIQVLFLDLILYKLSDSLGMDSGSIPVPLSFTRYYNFFACSFLSSCTFSANNFSFKNTSKGYIPSFVNFLLIRD